MREPDPDPALLAAYRAAEYVVMLDGRLLRFRPDALPPGPLAAWLDRNGPAGWVSAFNPGSRLLPVWENLRRHETLWQSLRDRGVEAHAGYAADPAGNWPDEPSLLVPGIDRAELNALAVAYGQVAFLWLEPGRPVGLWLARSAGAVRANPEGQPGPGEP